jgi:hypothetical protein
MAKGVNKAAVDQWTLGHAAVGAGLALLRVPAPVAVGFAIFFELIEDQLKERMPRIFPNASKDTKANALVDALASAAGYFLMVEIIKKRGKSGLL